MHHLMHRPLRLSVAEPATVTVPAAYEGGVTSTSELNRGLSCANDGVRFSAYNARVTKTVASSRALPALSLPAAPAVSR